jgi:hypothetical protein
MHIPYKKLSLIAILNIIGVFLIILSLPTFLSFFSKDIEEEDCSEFHLEKIIISEEENSYYDLMKIEGPIYDYEEEYDLIMDHLNGKIWDEEFVEEILSRNEQNFIHFDSATKKPKYQNPYFADMSELESNIDVVFPPIGHIREMSRLSSIKALRLARLGRDGEALDQAFYSIRIGKNINASRASLIAHLRAIATKKIGLMAVQTIIPSSNLSSNELKEYTQELKEFYSDKQWLINLSKCNHYFMSSWIDAIHECDEEVIGDTFGLGNIAVFKRKIKNNFYFHPNETKALFDREIRNMIQNFSKSCDEAKKIEIEESHPYYASNHSWIQRHFTENFVGKVLHNIFMIELELGSVSYSNHQANLFLSATRLLATLKAYKIDNGYLPDLLDELCPEYISEIPIDPFDCEPIRYSREKKILYSVGGDMEDSGGSIGDDFVDTYDWEKMPDPTFKINF